MNAQAAKDTATTTIVKPPYMQNRELSWLDFNKRVLDQGADPTVPLLERLNFISIFWSNLQEFFMVRVGSLTDLSLLKKSIIDPKSGMTPAQQLEASTLAATSCTPTTRKPTRACARSSPSRISATAQGGAHG